MIRVDGSYFPQVHLPVSHLHLRMAMSASKCEQDNGQVAYSVQLQDADPHPAALTGTTSICKRQSQRSIAGSIKPTADAKHSQRALLYNSMYGRLVVQGCIWLFEGEMLRSQRVSRLLICAPVSICSDQITRILPFCQCSARRNRRNPQSDKCPSQLGKP